MSEASRRNRTGTSWTSIILGWFAALGASLFFSGIVGAIFVVPGIGGFSPAAGGLSGLVGLLLALLIAFFIGGYVAGRLASRQGVKHGLLVPLLSLVIALVLTLVGAAVDASFVARLSGATLPGAVQSVPQQGLATILSVSGILALLLPFIGGALGGARGATVGRRRP